MYVCVKIWSQHFNYDKLQIYDKVENFTINILLPYHCTFYNTYFSSIVIRRYLILIKFLNSFALLRFSSVLESDLVNYRFREISISLKSSKNVVKLVYNNVLIWLNFCSICSDVSFLIIDVIFNCYCSLFPPKFL